LCLVGHTATVNQYRITDGPDRALRDLLSLCRRAGAEALLVLMPEAAELRAVYPPAVRAQIDAYVGGLSEQYGVPVVDMSTWVPEGRGYFGDGHHLRPHGAIEFTHRLGRDVCRPFVEGQLSASRRLARHEPR
jgi:hypothetical protein